MCSAEGRRFVTKNNMTEVWVLGEAKGNVRDVGSYGLLQ
jgi:hypothetical protein